MHFQHTGDTGILGIKKNSGWGSFSAMNSLPFHIKEAESVFSLKTQLKFFFFFFALQSFSKPLFNQETECILPSESSRYYKKFETKKRRKERKKGKDEKKKRFLHLYDMVWTINLPVINLLVYLPCFLSLYNHAFFWDFTMVIVLLVVPLVRLKFTSATINGFAQWQMWQRGQTECL